MGSDEEEEGEGQEGVVGSEVRDEDIVVDGSAVIVILLSLFAVAMVVSQSTSMCVCIQYPKTVFVREKMGGRELVEENEKRGLTAR